MTCISLEAHPPAAAPSRAWRRYALMAERLYNDPEAPRWQHTASLAQRFWGRTQKDKREF